MTFTSRWLEWQPDASQRAKKALAPSDQPPKPTKPLAERDAKRVSSVSAVDLTGEAAKKEAEPLAPPAPRELPAPPDLGEEPVLLSAEDLAPVPGTPHAVLEADWREARRLARAGFARHGAPPGEREADKFVRDAAMLECLLRTREREFAAWRERWRACLAGVYAGKVALLPGLERDLLATWRCEQARQEAAGETYRKTECAGQLALAFDDGEA